MLNRWRWPLDIVSWHVFQTHRVECSMPRNCNIWPANDRAYSERFVRSPASNLLRSTFCSCICVWHRCRWSSWSYSRCKHGRTCVCMASTPDRSTGCYSTHNSDLYRSKPCPCIHSWSSAWLKSCCSVFVDALSSTDFCRQCSIFYIQGSGCSLIV